MVRPVATLLSSRVTGGTAKNFVEIAKTVKPAVVNIAASRSGKRAMGRKALRSMIRFSASSSVMNSSSASSRIGNEKSVDRAQA